MYRYCSPLARRKHIVIVIAVVVIVPAGRPRDAQKPTPAVYTPRREQKDPTNHRGPQNAGCSGRVGSPSDDDDDEIPCTTDTADKRDGTRFDDGVSSRESSERVRAGNRKKFGPPPLGRIRRRRPRHVVSTPGAQPLLLAGSVQQSTDRTRLL